MNNEPIIVERTYNAPVEKVWSALTDKNKMKQWYFDIADFKPEVSAEFSFIGTDHDCKEWVHLCTVMEVIPNKKFKHSWRYEGHEGNSFVTWELFDEGGATRVKLTHEGLETFPAGIKAFARENFAEGWNHIVGTGLKEYLEKPSETTA